MLSARSVYRCVLLFLVIHFTLSFEYILKYYFVFYSQFSLVMYSALCSFTPALFSFSLSIFSSLLSAHPLFPPSHLFLLSLSLHYLPFLLFSSSSSFFPSSSSSLHFPLPGVSFLIHYFLPPFTPFPPSPSPCWAFWSRDDQALHWNKNSCIIWSSEFIVILDPGPAFQTQIVD